MKYRDKKWLHDQYVVKRKTTRDIANQCDLKCHVTILHWLKKHKIPTRKIWTKNPIYIGPQGYKMISF